MRIQRCILLWFNQSGKYVEENHKIIFLFVDAEKIFASKILTEYIVKKFLPGRQCGDRKGRDYCHYIFQHHKAIGNSQEWNQCLSIELARGLQENVSQKILSHKVNLKVE